MLDNGAADGVYPFLLLLLGIGDEVHGVAVGGELEGELLVEYVFRALDGEASADRDDATRLGVMGDVGVLEPEELASFEDEPAAAPGLDVLTLLGEPAGSLGSRPEIDALVILWLRVETSSGSPQALHFRLQMGNEGREAPRVRAKDREGESSNFISIQKRRRLMMRLAIGTWIRRK